MKVSQITAMIVGLVASGLLIGCGKECNDETHNQAKATLPAGMMVESRPEGTKPIAEVKKAVKEGDTIVIRGRIGGSKKPFVSEWATLTIVDLQQPNVCLGGKCDCSTPWDYCCGGTEKMLHMATVQVVDADGKPLKGTLRGVAGLDRLGILTVEGKVQQIKGNTLIVNAVKLHCDPYNPNEKVESSCGGCGVH